MLTSLERYDTIYLKKECERKMNDLINQFVEERKVKIKELVAKTPFQTYGLKIITDNSSKQSESYMKAKVRLGTELGIPTIVEAVSSEDDIYHVIRSAKELGYKTILQKPCAKKYEVIYEQLCKSIDADGFYTWNEVANGNNNNAPCTSTGILNFLEWHLGSLKGKTAAVVGRGDLSGKPIALQLINKGCTTISLNSKTTSVQKQIALAIADIVICATGVYGTVKASECKEGSIVMDVGICFDTGKLSGEFIDDEHGRVRYSKTPGGTGN
ncbi:MAG: hypothetical protein ACRC45_03595 [Cetobacterium sp.]